MKIDNTLISQSAAPDHEQWHFRVWHGPIDDIYVQRLFFWNDSRTETGIIDLKGDQATHISRIKSRMKKIARDRHIEQVFICPVPAKALLVKLATQSARRQCVRIKNTNALQSRVWSGMEWNALGRESRSSALW